MGKFSHVVDGVEVFEGTHDDHGQVQKVEHP
jgi:hypothetical protein